MNKLIYFSKKKYIYIYIMGIDYKKKYLKYKNKYLEAKKIYGGDNFEEMPENPQDPMDLDHWVDRYLSLDKNIINLAEEALNAIKIALRQCNSLKKKNNLKFRLETAIKSIEDKTVDQPPLSEESNPEYPTIGKYIDAFESLNRIYEEPKYVWEVEDIHQGMGGDVEVYDDSVKKLAENLKLINEEEQGRKRWNMAKIDKIQALCDKIELVRHLSANVVELPDDTVLDKFLSESVVKASVDRTSGAAAAKVSPPPPPLVAQSPVDKRKDIEALQDSSMKTETLKAFDKINAQSDSPMKTEALKTFDKIGEMQDESEKERVLVAFNKELDRIATLQDPTEKEKALVAFNEELDSIAGEQDEAERKKALAKLTGEEADTP